MFQNLQRNALFKISGVISHCFSSESKLPVACLIHEVKPVNVTVEERCWRQFDVGLFKLLTRSKALLHDRASQQMAQLRSNHGRSAARRWRREKDIHDGVRLTVNSDH